jgi:hypothetical protein
VEVETFRNLSGRRQIGNRPQKYSLIVAVEELKEVGCNIGWSSSAENNAPNKNRLTK